MSIWRTSWTSTLRISCYQVRLFLYAHGDGWPYKKGCLRVCVLKRSCHVVSQSVKLLNQPPEESADDLIATGFLCYHTFWELREFFRVEELQLFQLTQKAHQNMHCCLLCTALSPRRTWCFGAEDFMGKMRTLALSASKGASGVAVSRRMLEKYLIALHLTLLDPKAWFWRRV